MWKPILSAAYQVRFVVMPPKARVATVPSSFREKGQPQFSSRASSFGASWTKYWMQSWSPEEVRALDGVEAVQLEVVVVARDRGGAAFGGHGMAPHRIDLGNKGNRGGRIVLRGFDGSPETCPTTADDDDVMSRNVHEKTSSSKPTRDVVDETPSGFN